MSVCAFVCVRVCMRRRYICSGLTPYLKDMEAGEVARKKESIKDALLNMFWVAHQQPAAHRQTNGLAQHTQQKTKQNKTKLHTETTRKEIRHCKLPRGTPSAEASNTIKGAPQHSGVHFHHGGVPYHGW